MSLVENSTDSPTAPVPSPELFSSTESPLPTEELSTVLVTPGLARAWLKRNTHNRPMKKYTLETFERQMREGLWRYNGDTIVFSHDGVLRDGQTRLTAVVNSGRAQTFVVVTGVDPEAQKTMDAGAPRSVGDNLGLDGYKNRTNLAAAASMALRFAKDRRDLARMRLKFGTPEVEAFLEAHPEFPEFVNAASSHWRHYQMKVSPLAFGMWTLHGVDRSAAERFFEDWREARTEGAGDPLNTLIRRLQRNQNPATAADKLDTYTQVAFLFITWNYRQRGEKLDRLLRSGAQGRVRIPDPILPGTRDSVKVTYERID